MAEISRMKVIDLKRELKMRGLKGTGNKTALVARLQSAVMMNFREPKFKNKHVAKMKKLNHYDDERSKDVNEIPDTNAEKSPGILDMPIEIIEYIFDNLHIVELSAVSRTCKYMQQVAHHCYHRTYSGVQPNFNNIEGSGMVFMYRSGDLAFIDVEHFIPVFDKIQIHRYKNANDEVLYKFIDQQSEFHQLTQLKIREMNLTNVNINDMKGVLSKLEYMEIIGCELNDEFLENLFKLTPNIKRFYLDIYHTEQVTNRWLERNYSTLEHCEIVSKTFVPITVFLTHNPNIRKFGTNLMNVWKNIHLIKAGEINLEVLAIIFNSSDYLNDLDLCSFWRLIDEYCHLGIYKRLHLIYQYIFRIFNQKTVDGITVSTAVDRFFAMVHDNSYACVALSELNFLANVVDFTFYDSRFIIDIETLASKLGSLKRIHFIRTNLSHVKIFIRGNVKLQEIQIDWFMSEAGIKEKMKVLNLIELNKERAKLLNANKITLFVEEPVYLVTKRANQDTELEFIKLIRTDTMNEKQFDFGYPIHPI